MDAGNQTLVFCENNQCMKLRSHCSSPPSVFYVLGSVSPTMAVLGKPFTAELYPQPKIKLKAMCPEYTQYLHELTTIIIVSQMLSLVI